MAVDVDPRICVLSKIGHWGVVKPDSFDFWVIVYRWRNLLSMPGVRKVKSELYNTITHYDHAHQKNFKGNLVIDKYLTDTLSCWHVDGGPYPE